MTTLKKVEDRLGIIAILLPKIFERRLMDEAYSLLVQHHDCGPFDGGCVVFARALQLAYGGNIEVLVGSVTAGYLPQALHAVLHVGSMYGDADGFATKHHLIARFQKAELLSGGRVSSVRPILSNDLPDAPRDEALSKQIAEIIQ